MNMSTNKGGESKVRGVKKEKMSDGGKFIRKKCLRVVESAREKEDMGDDDDAMDEEEREEENEKEFEMPEVVGICLNLSRKNMRDFPEELLERMLNVQYLYLEGNKLRSLPDCFFQKLRLLKWLDLRNNNLSALPTVGLRNHSNLEVVLLQGNCIRNLPLELASIPSLKGLQTVGNPITNVPYEVIAEGFQAVMKYLEKLAAQEKILLPVSESVLVKPSTSKDNPGGDFPGGANEPTDMELRIWDSEKLSQWRHFMKKRSENPKRSEIKSQKTQDKLLLQQPKIYVSLRSHPKLPLRPPPFRCGVYNKGRHRSMASAYRYLRMRKTRLGYKRRPITMAMVQEKTMQEAYRAQVRETLEKQARKIQRMRDREVLKNWRDHARITRDQMKLLDNYQQYPSKDFASKTPFDVDPEFLNMLNRVDLYRSLKDYDNRSKRIKKPRVRITAIDLERQMNEIMKKLQQLDTNDSEDNTSPRAKQSHMCNKMYKIMDIQKTLKNLQTLNSSMNGIVPIIKSKPNN